MHFLLITILNVELLNWGEEDERRCQQNYIHYHPMFHYFTFCSIYILNCSGFFSFSLQVQAWLDSLYAGKPVPSFERSERTIDLLYQLMQRNLAIDQDTQLIIQDLRQKAMEYTAEGKKRLLYFTRKSIIIKQRCI